MDKKVFTLQMKYIKCKRKTSLRYLNADPYVFVIAKF